MDTGLEYLYLGEWTLSPSREELGHKREGSCSLGEIFLSESGLAPKQVNI